MVPFKLYLILPNQCWVMKPVSSIVTCKYFSRVYPTDNILELKTLQNVRMMYLNETYRKKIIWFSAISNISIKLILSLITYE